MSSSEFVTNQPRRNKSRILTLIGIGISVYMISTIPNVITALRADSWQPWLNLFSGILGLALTTLAFNQVRKENYTIAGRYVLGAVYISVVATVVIFTGLGLPLQLIVSIFGVVLSFELFTGRAQFFGILISVVIGYIVFGLDLLDMSWRVPAASPTSTAISFGSMIVFFLFYTLRNFRSYGLRTRLIYIILGANAIAILGIGFTSNYVITQYNSQNTNRKLLSAATALSDKLDTFFEKNLDTVRVHSSNPVLLDFLALPSDERAASSLNAQINRYISVLGYADPYFIKSYGILDRAGVVVADINKNAIGSNESLTGYFQNALIQQLPYVSPVILNRENKPVIYFSAPVRNDQQEFIGVLRVEYDAEILQSIIISKNKSAGDASFGILLDDYNILLAHGEEPGLIGVPLAMPDEGLLNKLRLERRLPAIISSQNFADLETFLSQAEQNAVFSTELVTTVNPQEANAAADTLIYQPWKVVFMQPTQIGQIPITQQTNFVVLAAEFLTILGVILGVVIARNFTAPIISLSDAAKSIFQGNLDVTVDIHQRDEIGILAKSFNSMASDLRNVLRDLEQRVQVRTQAIETGALVGRRISAILNVNELVREVVFLLQTAFNYSHVQLFLMDENNEYLELKGGSGEIGARLVEQGLKIPNGVGPVGRAAGMKEVVLIRNTMDDPSWSVNPLLPDTRSEISVPIISSDKVLGVLDVQQNNPDGLGQQDSDLLQIIASQIAATLKNSNYYATLTKQTAQISKVAKIVEAIRASKRVDQALKISVRELGRGTSAPHVLVKYQPEIHKTSSEMNSLPDDQIGS